ncbi:MAG TPA: HD domain-containing phosphohydrolase [Thermoleophilaceae bacterium]|nr:HD domain-containing phosphohydrolase [Thermoleophilaceae bacterium]
MGKSQSRKLIAHLPLVVFATSVVVLAPTLFVLWLRESGTVDSMWLALAIGVVMSLTASQVGAAIWKSRADSELLFNELMLWGWVQRFRSERRLAAASDLLGLSAGRPKAISGGQLSGEEKKQLLTQLTSSLESSDPYTHGHSRRVARHAANIAKQMGLSGPEVAKIRAAGAMHDVGKVETPTLVLHKAGRLTDEEFDIVKRHPVDGADMVATLDDDELTAIVRHHHERLDGTGYPDGLAGDEIPLGARILAVADTFDAITSTRPYRQANPHKKALDILETEAGTQLDPVAVKAFLECYSGMKPVAFWAVLINARPRVSASLGQVFSPVTGTNVIATTAAAAAVGAVAVGPGAHTVPASSQTGATDAVLIASSSPFARDADRITTVRASLLADPDVGVSGTKRAERTDGPEPKSPGKPEKATSEKKIGGAPAARDRDHASERPAGGHADPGAPAKDGDGTSGNGDAPVPSQEKKPADGNGNAYGHDKPDSGRGNAYGHTQGNGNAYGHAPGTGLGQGNSQGQRQENGNANGLGKGVDKVKEKAGALVAPATGD